MALYRLRVTHAGRSYGVRSALEHVPVVGDTILYAGREHRLLLVVSARLLAVPSGVGLEAWVDPSCVDEQLEQRLRGLAFRPEEDGGPSVASEIA